MPCASGRACKLSCTTARCASTTTTWSERCGPLQNPVYSAHVGSRAQVYYPWHPAFGRIVPVLYRERRRGEEVAICEMADGSREVLPSWMLDAELCAVMNVGSPKASMKALSEVAAFLGELGFSAQTARATAGGEEVPCAEKTAESDSDVTPSGLPPQSEARRAASAGARLSSIRSATHSGAGRVESRRRGAR